MFSCTGTENVDIFHEVPVTDWQTEGMEIAKVSVDAGQSGVQLRVEAEGSKPRQYSLPPVDTSEAVAPQLVYTLSQFFRQENINPGEVAIASTGVSNTTEAAELVLQGLGTQGARRVLFAHDSVSGFLSALGYQQGVVTMVGTGIVTLGVGRKLFSRVDGWGNILGDAGSGYWIGRRGMEAAMRSYDSRGEPTVLLEHFQALFPNVEDAYLELQADTNPVFRVAQFAKTVVNAAAKDNVASRIVDDACDEIAQSIKVASRKAGADSDGQVMVSASGSIARNPEFFLRLVRKIRTHLPGAKVVEPLGDPLDGVALMAGLDASSPLKPLVAIAET